MDLIEQGNVYYGFRSDKYPEVCCYAVIISARCDIANNKISKLYYLTAVDAKDWFCTKAGFDLVYAAAIKENLKNQLSNFEINIDILLKFPEEVALKVITGNCPEKRRRDLEKIIETYQMAHKAFSDNTTFFQRKNIAATINSGKGKHAVTFLKKISSGETNHFQFIPKSAYTEKTIKSMGLL